VVVATAVKATIGSNLRAGNRNRELAARASHTPRVLPGPSPAQGPRTRTPGTVGKRETRGPAGSSTRTSFFSSRNRQIRESAGTAQYRRSSRRTLLNSMVFGYQLLSIPFLLVLPLFLTYAFRAKISSFFF